ncbi:hypothetical protein JB92DRAFT_2928190 [Gautieria morchelliformis]|nr:hypothetical protein JB92DRAFT_2928190 [Gautieria morchelliformis]
MSRSRHSSSPNRVGNESTPCTLCGLVICGATTCGVLADIIGRKFSWTVRKPKHQISHSCLEIIMCRSLY